MSACRPRALRIARACDIVILGQRPRLQRQLDVTLATTLPALKIFSVPQSHRRNHSAPLLLTADFTTTSQPSRRPANSFAVAQPQLKERLVKRFTPFTALSVPQSHRHNHITMCHLSRPACRSTYHRPKRRPVRSLPNAALLPTIGTRGHGRPEPRRQYLQMTRLVLTARSAL